MTTHSDTLLVSDYVICATLRKVSDVFNAALLWERLRGGQEGVFLLEALRRYPRLPVGRQHQESCYSHVVIRVPEKEFLRDDRLDDGGARETLLQDLRRLHERQLSHALAENATVRYRVQGDPLLRPGEVQFLFGRAIYVPSAVDSPLFRVQAAGEGQDDWRELGPIYAGQRLTLLNADRRASSFAVEGWPFMNGESVLLVLRSGASAQVDALSEPPNALNLSDDGDGGFLVRDRRGRALRVRAAPGTASMAQALKASERRVVAAPARPEPPETAPAAERLAELEDEPLTALEEVYPATDVWGRREPMLDLSVEFDDLLSAPPLDDEEGFAPTRTMRWPDPATSTSLPEPAADQQTWIPQRPAAILRVAGVALQRLSTYAAAGISDWRIGFSRTGHVVPSEHPEAAAWVRVDNTDQVFGEVDGYSTPLALPGLWEPFDDLELAFQDAPPPMNLQYVGWLRLPAPLALPVPRERAVSFGRGVEADLAPRLLADPHALRWGGRAAKTAGINAEYLGLSRRHLLLQARRDDWWVHLESQSMSAYRLAPTGELLDVLIPGKDTATTARANEFLVVGGYVLELGAVQ
ncbi:MAG: hypothetical protein IPL51_09170 [Candidatus Competibacteraceae bacterium]|nr:hypothetical protein [Candidatus Competibacteraceae bacterium]